MPPPNYSITVFPVRPTYKHTFPFSNISNDDITNDLSTPYKDHINNSDAIALDRILDNEHRDYTALGNIDPDTNVLLNTFSNSCTYYTEK